jgi:hypothetical protein
VNWTCQTSSIVGRPERICESAHCEALFSIDALDASNAVMIVSRVCPDFAFEFEILLGRPTAAPRKDRDQVDAERLCCEASAIRGELRPDLHQLLLSMYCTTRDRSCSR